ncbi:Protein kinase, partial [Candidatus Arthromitus sp. SFB-2]
MIGKVIGGRYEIIEKLGEGGMANVYKAKCKILKRFTTIKILKQELTNDEEFVRKFKDEAMEVAKLSDNNIVKVYDIGVEDNLHYIVMEYIDGKTLKEYISE